MLEHTDTDLTLPSVVASLPGNYRDQDLVLTVIFHPDTARIGHTAVVPRHTGNAPWILGRCGPAFGDRDDQSVSPLADPHVSRRALEFLYQGKQLIIRRFGDSSRCRLGARELYDSVELDLEQLQSGIPLLLGHSVVLLLRLGRSRPPAVEISGRGDLMRGGSACMDRLREQIAQAAASDLDVLIRGETGTGKELVATAIHGASRRASGPLVCVNMAAIPTELAAAALFGSARGAFTGADKAAAGYFQQAEGGSLFLDEIGDTSTAVQPLLLRALQQREIQAVGGPVRRVDVRVISATDAALDGAGCDFKAALRHRLGACEIVLPPLREHPEDIGELLLYFLTHSAEQAGRPALLPHAHSAAPEIAAWAGLFFSFLGYSWPGNVRELENFARQVVLASEQQLTVSDYLQTTLAAGDGSQRPAQGQPRRRKMQDVDEEEFDNAMRANCFEVMRVAQQLGVSRASVYRRIDASPEYRLASEVPADEVQRVLAGHAGNSDAAGMQLRVSLSSLRSRVRKLNL